MKRLLVLLCSILAVLSAAAAGDLAGTPRFIVIDQEWKGDFHPEAAFFIVDFDRTGARRIPALLLETGKSNESQEWFFGAAVRVSPKRGNLRYVLIVKGSNNRYSLSAPRETAVTEQALGGTTDELRSKVEQRKEILESWNLQAKTQEDSLNRLRSDADVIGELGRITDASEEVTRLQEHIAAAEQDIASLKHFLRLAGAEQTPINFERCMNSLNKQLTELAQAVRLVESGELVRKSRSEAQLRRQLKLVEETRGESFDALKRELDQLRTRRQQLEAKVDALQGYDKPAAPANPSEEYELPQG